MNINKKQLKQGEMLCTTTVRIESIDDKDRSYNGTGFFYSIDLPDQDYLPLIITNKHVVEDCIKITIVFTEADEFGNRTDNHFYYLIDDIQKYCIVHPNDDIDLCAINISPLISKFLNKGIQIHTYYINKSIIPNEEVSKNLDSIEEIIMVGYPDGLWDDKNNLPIVRRGITATDPKIDYQGKKEFIIDAACFEGSSGSPIFYIDKSYKAELPHQGLGYKIYLLGILFEGPKTEIHGVIDRPGTNVKTKMEIMLNLGFAINSNQLLALETEVLNTYNSYN